MFCHRNQLFSSFFRCFIKYVKLNTLGRGGGPSQGILDCSMFSFNTLTHVTKFWPFSGYRVVWKWLSVRQERWWRWCLVSQLRKSAVFVSLSGKVVKMMNSLSVEKSAVVVSLSREGGDVIWQFFYLMNMKKMWRIMCWDWRRLVVMLESSTWRSDNSNMWRCDRRRKVIGS